MEMSKFPALQETGFCKPGPPAYFLLQEEEVLSPEGLCNLSWKGQAEIEKGSDSPGDTSPSAAGLSLQQFPGHPFIACLHPAPCTTFSGTSLSFS